MKSGVYFTWSLLLLCGCAQSPWARDTARTYPIDQVPDARERVQEVEKILDESKSAVPLLRAQNPDNPGVARTSSSASQTPTISHDAATLALIDKETRNFSPEDRDRAVAALKAIPSESVPAVLQLWKAGLISPLAHPNSPVILAPATAADLPHVKLTSASDQSPQAGLGQNSPWPTGTGPKSPTVMSTDGKSAADKATSVSQDIARVSTPRMGFSSPLEDVTTIPTTPLANDNNAIQRLNYSPGVQTPPDWDPVQGGRSSGPAMSAPPPRDWPSQGSLPPVNRPENYSSPFGSDDGAVPSRQIINPPDWQANAASNQVGQSNGPLISPRLPPPQATPAPLYQPPPIVEPAPRSVDGPARESETDIPLVPGQILPGFNAPATAVPPVQRMSGREAVPTAGMSPVPLPAAVPAVQSTTEALRFLIKATESEVGQLRPGQTATELQYYIERQVYLRLLYLVAGQTEWALRPIPNIPAADQEFWTQVLWGVHNYFDMPRIPDHAERAAQTVAQFNTAMLRLKERAPLELNTVTFCHKIEGYGEYDTYSKDEFTPGQRVLVYAEIGNFHSELSAEGIYRTRLKSTLQICSAESGAEPVDTKVYPVTEDFCRNHRRDYFHSYVVEIPVRCTRGGYILKLRIEDELSGKTAEYPLSFNVR